MHQTVTDQSGFENKTVVNGCEVATDHEDAASTSREYTVTTGRKGD